MTLNITVAARWLMTQSSDFRLTGSGATVSETSQKQVVLQYMGWSGLVCYTGVARYGPHDTAAWLADVLTHNPGQRSPEQVVNRLVEEATVWLRQVPIRLRCHTFTMITYERGKPKVYVISNFERPNGPQLATPADKLFWTRVRPRGPRCIVTGYSPAVVDSQREELEGLLASVPSPERLREAVATTSRESSARAEGTVGESCVVAHLCPDGSGEAQVFGNLSEEFLPTMITNGHNIASLVPTVMDQAGRAGPHRLVGATWSANGAATAMLGAYRALSQQAGSGWPSSTSSASGDK
ncbi:hypothetical protein [Streptomyces europaeiscabiei]|uniref:hypothetical protein n=1 Tax=Streptomyces europaeiscabiei TaxID=146819 RepID=UPI0029B75D46|nr:hypothetical protein [Streptomyces europaeiscabiei]MDX2530817.1 hypothetical protein [Streptomyces europaeiscabiei]